MTIGSLGDRGLKIEKVYAPGGRYSTFFLGRYVPPRLSKVSGAELILAYCGLLGTDFVIFKLILSQNGALERKKL